jgi:acetylornithine deacetylase/succinyl-diaminopimelate desuccinylase-like protein
MFDARWAEHGHMERAVAHMADWARRNGPDGMVVEIVRLPGRTPLLLIEVAGTVETDEACVLLYGHLDKQPEMEGWAAGRGPWSPTIEDDRLYGRGAADDGYAMFAALAAVRALQEQQVPHARCILIIEASEESGSCDLPHYLEHLASRFGNPSLVICLDSGCGTYDRLWMTTSLRGVVVMDLTVEVLTEGVHSGAASGIVPSSFRVLRQLLSRLEEETAGTILPAALHAPIPAEHLEQTAAAAAVLGSEVISGFPWIDSVQPMTGSVFSALLNRSWRPALSVIGMDGVPPASTAGNVLRPSTSATLSLRLPPPVDPHSAHACLQELFETEPPYGARVRTRLRKLASGWAAAPFPSWLRGSIEAASLEFFGRPAVCFGEGGSIGFVGTLGRLFPSVPIVVTGVLGPSANAHGPNEFLHIPTAKRVTACIARLLADHAAAGQAGCA